MAGNPNRIADLRQQLASIPAVPIETAAKLLEVSVRTMYRRRSQFECIRRKGHWYITLRSIQTYMTEEHYSPTTFFDETKNVSHF